LEDLTASLDAEIARHVVDGNLIDFCRPAALVRAEGGVDNQRTVAHENHSLVGFFVLSAEVESHHSGGDDHDIVGGDVASQCQHGKDRQDYKGHDGLDLDEVSQIFQHTDFLLNL
jgi:hypothetical protein